MTQPMAAMRPLFWKLFWAAPGRFLLPGLYFNARRILPLPRPYHGPELIYFGEVNLTIAKDQPEYRPLPCWRQNRQPGRIVCCWQFGWRDRLRVLFRGVVWHEILTFNKPLQPQNLTAKKPVMEQL